MTIKSICTYHIRKLWLVVIFCGIPTCLMLPDLWCQLLRKEDIILGSIWHFARIEVFAQILPQKAWLYCPRRLSLLFMSKIYSSRLEFLFISIYCVLSIRAIHLIYVNINEKLRRQENGNCIYGWNWISGRRSDIFGIKSGRGIKGPPGRLGREEIKGIIS